MSNQTLSFFLLLLCVTISSSFHFSVSENQNYIRRGSSLSVEDDSNIITSPDNTFTSGFYSLGENAYWFAIWFTNSRHKTVVWLANRDSPVNGKRSELKFRRNGAIALTDYDGTMVWETNTTSTDASRLSLLDTGNLVLENPHGGILWQSFDYPTDTLLPSQKFTKNKRLTSALRKDSFATGYFSMYFDSDNALKLIYDGPEISSLYWPNPDHDLFGNGRTNYNSSRIAILNDIGSFVSSDRWQFAAYDLGLGVKRRLTMDYDGNLRLYSLKNSTGEWEITWRALTQQCNVHGLCGRNGICVYSPEPKCSCPPAYEPNDRSNWNQGCKPVFDKTCLDREEVFFLELPYTDYYGFDLNYTKPISLDGCRELCLGDCWCQAFSYRLTGEGVCFTKGELFNGYQSESFPGAIYLKLPIRFQSQPSILNGSNAVCGTNPAKVTMGSSLNYEPDRNWIKFRYLFSFCGAIGAVEALFIAAGWWFLFRKSENSTNLEKGFRLISGQFRRFSHAELKAATGKFSQEVGRGSFGSVYKGVLEDGREVAVKRLGSLFQGEAEFWAEISTIGKINHMNLVKMWGFCSEGRNKLLVYEFIENRSLNEHLFGSDSFGWRERFKIALGMAKGLAYLHHECLEWIIHCDVKPENILLDSEFQPKIADFGLAKLSQRGGPYSEFSKIRGTKGYMAPEWALNLPITAKVDVYSYGVVVLEMVKGVRLSNWVVKEEEEGEEAELKRLVRKVKVKIKSGEEGWIDEVVDSRLGGEFSVKEVETLVKIGLSCVEEDRNLRPTMDSVVQTLLECEDE